MATYNQILNKEYTPASVIICNYPLSSITSATTLSQIKAILEDIETNEYTNIYTTKSIELDEQGVSVTNLNIVARITADTKFKFRVKSNQYCFLEVLKGGVITDTFSALSANLNTSNDYATSSVITLKEEDQLQAQIHLINTSASVNASVTVEYGEATGTVGSETVSTWYALGLGNKLEVY